MASAMRSQRTSFSPRVRLREVRDVPVTCGLGCSVIGCVPGMATFRCVPSSIAMVRAAVFSAHDTDHKQQAALVGGAFAGTNVCTPEGAECAMTRSRAGTDLTATNRAATTELRVMGR